LRRQAAEHAETVTAGRTHLQHALPVTFGYRCAVWLSALDRHAERLQQVPSASTQGSVRWGGRGLWLLWETVASTFDRHWPASWGWENRRLPGTLPEMGFVEVVGLLAMIGGSLGKAAYDVTMMASSEFAEVAEPFCRRPWRELDHASETQSRLQRDHARCRKSSSVIATAACLMPCSRTSNVPRGPWHVEWVALPEAFLLAGSALEPSVRCFRRPCCRRRPNAEEPRRDWGSHCCREGNDGNSPSTWVAKSLITSSTPRASEPSKRENDSRKFSSMSPECRRFLMPRKSTS
jgi:3-carboxy-cis,cis-muconate cycloisomerase